MGLFSNLFGKKNSPPPAPPGTPVEQSHSSIPLNTYKPPENSTFVSPTSSGILNLKKNDILDLSKVSPNLQRIRVAAGWDVNTGYGADYDLDLCAFLLDEYNRPVRNVVNPVYYGNKRSTGIYLDGDNLTGEGDGDDENIFVTLEKLPQAVKRIVFNVVIYQASSRGQCFGKVRNAYVRIVDEYNGGRELCRFNLSDDGGNSSAVVFAELYKDNGAWNFRAIGEYTNGSIQSLFKKY